MVRNWGLHMIKWMTAAAAAMAVVGAVPASAALVDGSFETQGAAMAGSNFCYFGQGCATTTPWTGNTGAGMQNENNGAWPGAQSPAGTYYAFIQNTGAFGQTFSLNAGAYTLSWLAAGRPAGCCGGNQQYNVLLDGAIIYTGGTTTGQAFTGITSNAFSVATTGNHTLTFQGLSNGPDNTAFIDNVSLTASVPEPATWAMLMLGFGALGGMLRSRRRSVFAAA